MSLGIFEMWDTKSNIVTDTRADAQLFIFFANNINTKF